MARLESPNLLFVTSPRSPLKMRPEINLLVTEFSGQTWERNCELQRSFARRLAELPNFEGQGSADDPAFSARDRITRGPKSLGFVRLDRIALTPTGEMFFDDNFREDALLRQLLKFQLPSPFHKITNRTPVSFRVRPYLEILRLVYKLGRLAFDELMLFGMQLTDYTKFDEIVAKVTEFRIEKEHYKGQCRRFLHEAKERVVKEIYANEIANGRTGTRQSSDCSLTNFISTKARTLRDYADACIRYMRSTGLLTISNPGRTLSIIESRKTDVEYILNHIDREPVFVDDLEEYRKHLYSATTPMLYTDIRTNLIDRAVNVSAVSSRSAANEMTTVDLKRKIRTAEEGHRKAVIDAQITELKSFARYDDIIAVYNAIKNRSVYDQPLALEWNTWRAMTMLDGGSVHANLTFDAAGNPLSTAPGNCADIVCDYGTFSVAVEVTMTSGARQYEAEGESVGRHLGRLKKDSGREAYCLFVAPTINQNVITYFYTLHKCNLSGYGGKSVLIPLPLDRFIGMVRQTKANGSLPVPEKVKAFFEYSKEVAQSSQNEFDWYKAVCERADAWLAE